MKLKKLMVLFLTAIVVSSNLLVSSVFAGSNPYITMEFDKTKAKVGEIVRVSIKINDIDNFCGCQVNISYDKNCLEAVNPDTGVAYNDSSKPLSGTLLVNEDFAPFKISKFDTKNGRLTFGSSYVDVESYKNANNPESTGVFAVVGFKVLKEVQTEIKFSDNPEMPNSKSGTLIFCYVTSPPPKNYSVINPVYSVNQPPVLNEGVVETPVVSSSAVASQTPAPTSVNTPTATSAVSSSSTPTPTPKTVDQSPVPSKPGSEPQDLAVSVSSDKSIYKEQQIVTYTVKYINRSDNTMRDVSIKAQIPQFTTIEDNGGGTVKDKSVEWKIKYLDPGIVKEITYSVKVGNLDKEEVIAANNVEISGVDNTGKSSINVLLCSDRFGKGTHKSYVTGYDGKLFKPEKEITRAEIAVMFARILELDTTVGSEQLYNDVPLKHWAAGYINAVSEKGIFSGYSNNTFNPNGLITRAEMATAISRYLGFKDTVPFETHFKDTGKHWASKYIEEVYRLKLVNGYKDNTFLPNNKIKRSEAVTMLNKMLYRGPVVGAVSTFKDVSQKHWAVGQIEEAVNDHTYSRNSEGQEVLEK